jgi:hypothetical protein
MSSILETFFILFQTDAKRAQSEVEGAQSGMVSATEAAALKMTAADAVKTAASARNAAKVALAQAVVAESELGVVAAVHVREAAEAAQAAARLAESRAIIAANALEAAGLGAVAVEAEGAAFAFGGLIGTAIKLAAGFFSVNLILNTLKGTLADINTLTEKADRFNMNVEGYNAFNQVIEDMGGNAEKAERFLRRFADNVSDAFGDASSVAGKAMTALGVSTKDAEGNLKDTEAVMLDVAGAMEKLSQEQQIAKLRDLGVVDPAMRELLTGGRANLASRFQGERDKGLITNKQAADVRAFKMAWDDAKDAVAGFFNTLVGSWAPSLTRFANRLENFVMWLREHSGLVQGLGVAAAIGLGVLVAFLWGSYIPAWAAAAVATLVALAPIILITAAVAALAAAFALAWEDVQAFLSGQPSLLGDLVAKYEGVRVAVDLIGKAWRMVTGYVSDTLAVWGAVFRGIAAVAGWVFRQIWRVAEPILSLLGDAFGLAARVAGTELRVIWAVVQEVFGRIWPYVQPIFDAIKTGISIVGVFAAVGNAIWGQWGAMFDRFVQRVKDVVGAAKQLLGAAEGVRADIDAKTRPAGAAQTAPAVAAGRGQLARAAANPMAAQAGAAAMPGKAGKGDRTQSVKIDKVEVQTQATDAGGIAKAIGGALGSQLRRTSSQWDDGVSD